MPAPAPKDVQSKSLPDDVVSTFGTWIVLVSIVGGSVWPSHCDPVPIT